MALDSLNLSNNQITDVTPIKEIEVKNLNLSCNQIEDATPLTGMALEGLNISGNRITDITPLCSLTQIKELDISWNNISDLSPLKGSSLWKRLQEYAIATQDTFELDYYIGTVSQSHIRKIEISYGNPLTREQVIEALPEELINYTVGKKHPFRDEMVATGRTWMDSQVFPDEIIKNDETGIPDPNLYQALLEAGDANQDGVLTSEEASRITEVNTRNKGITDLTGLVYLRGGIHKLDLRENNISDLTPLAKGPYFVDYLYLDHNNISDITPLSNMTFPVGVIRLSYNNISDTTPLKDLVLLELYLDHNKISSIESMSEIVDNHYLEVLNLSDNNITDISPLAGSVSIRKLNLSNNKIQDLSVLEKLTYVTSLLVDGNPISDISPIGTLENLSDARLDETQIPDLEELKNYDNLNSLWVCAKRFFDENGNNKIANTIYNFIQSGSSYKSKQPEIEGYEPASEEGYVTYKGTLTEDITYVDFYYKKLPEAEDCIIEPSGENTEVSNEKLNEIITTNQNSNVIFKSNLEITITFAKGTMKAVDGLMSFDMGSKVEKDYDKVGEKVHQLINRDDMVSYISYNYSGELPGEAEIKINVGLEWSGKDLYYYYYNAEKGILELLQKAVVDSEGIMTVRQNHCSDYVISDKRLVNVSDEKELKAIRAFVNRLYGLVLNREAEESGIESWTSALFGLKSSGVDTGYGFVFSPECTERNLSNDDFVEMLYNTFMDRPSDEGGKSAWVSQLESGVEREKVLEGFIMSPEFAGICEEYGIAVGTIDSVAAFEEALSHYCNQNADVTSFVARCYTKALGREYDPVGLEDWCRVIVTQEDTPTSVARCFIFSDEFTGRNLSDEEYVKVLYHTFMGREADEGGLAAWVGVLKSGEENREKVLEGFANSPEFEEILVSFGLNE